VIEDKFVDLYARNSGLRDKLVAERDVVLTYALRVLLDTGVMDHLAFKGGTCLRKLIFGSAGRFSEDPLLPRESRRVKCERTLDAG
jgi:predicted nucleotidyltransferase component of viral defense system